MSWLFFVNCLYIFSHFYFIYFYVKQKWNINVLLFWVNIILSSNKIHFRFVSYNPGHPGEMTYVQSNVNYTMITITGYGLLWRHMKPSLLWLNSLFSICRFHLLHIRCCTLACTETFRSVIRFFIHNFFPYHSLRYS